MRLLVDTCVALQVVSALRAAGHDVVFVGDYPEDPGDAEILRQAGDARRILITRDKDFGLLSVLGAGTRTGVILLRGLPLAQQGAACLATLAKHGADLESGSLVVVQPGRLRIRRPNRP